MGQDNKKKDKSPGPSWDFLKRPPQQPKGPPKPWPEEIEQNAEEFVEFLKDADSKNAVKDFIIETYKKYEAERIERLKSRYEHESSVNRRGSSEFHSPGNIEPMMHDDLNMIDVENAFARSLRGTRSNLVRSIEERVEDINRLLADIGGFSAQLKSCFARSTVVFLEQEDPKHTFRERLIFSINLPNYELKRPWEKGSFSEKKGSRTGDGRTALQITWDEAVNALAKIVETTGLKPKYCKNDRHYGRFVMKQDLRSKVNIPDEYFSFTLDYNTQEKIKEMCGPYNRIVDDYEDKLKKLVNRIKKFPENSRSSDYAQLKKKHLMLSQERDYFIGTTPDPNQLDEGLLFLIEVSTLKDYHIVKDRMQSIMTRYILYLSKIAAKEAQADAELEYQLSKAGHAIEEPHTEKEGQSTASPAANDFHDMTADDLMRVPQYTIHTEQLNPLPKEPRKKQPAQSARKKKAA